MVRGVPEGLSRCWRWDRLFSGVLEACDSMGSIWVGVEFKEGVIVIVRDMGLHVAAI